LTTVQKTSRQSGDPIWINTMSANDRKSTQRERLLNGMIEAANREGYASANVSQVIANAGVSRPTFYDYFADKDDCFLAAYHEIARRLLELVRLAVAGGPPERATQQAVMTLIEFAGSDPVGARFLTNEIMAGGPRALDERDRTLDQIEQIVERARKRASPAASTPDLPTGPTLGAVYWLLAPILRRGESDLSELAEDLMTWIESYAKPASEHRWRALRPGPAIPPSPYTSELSLQAPSPLPRGRPRASAADVARNQRERILFATAEVAVEKGYSAARIADITAAAGVDGRVFYAHFRDKQQAFLAVHELGSQQMMAVSAGAYFSGATWPERIWEGVRASAHFNASYPVIFHIGFVESHAVGSPALQRTDDGRTAFTIFLQEGYQQNAGSPPRKSLEAIAAATFEIGYRQIRSGKGRDMPRFVPFVVYLCLAPFLNPQMATEFVDRKLSEIDSHTPSSGV
jgi:AcrR family transcriptional regulator